MPSAIKLIHKSKTEKQTN